MTDDHLHRAREALAAGDADASLAELAGQRGAAVAWLRALAAAHLGDPLRVHLALRDATRQTALPSTAVEDVARPFAEAVLADDPAAAAWRPLAVAVHQARGALDVQDDVELAVSLVCAALARPEPADPPALLVALTGLRRHLGHLADTLDLARTAQDVARRAGDAEALAAATLLLAEAVHADGDVPTADAVIRHGGRWLDALDPTAATRLAARWTEIRAAWASPD